MTSRKCDVEVAIEVGDRRYAMTVISYSPGSPSSWEDPGDGPEIDISGIVEVSGAMSGEEFVTYETFITELALERGISIDKAEDFATDFATQRTDEYFADRYDDAREYEQED